MKTITATALVSAASACLSSLIFVGIVNVATTSNVDASVAPMQTVTVSANRMTAEEKLAYDLELSQSANPANSVKTQVIVISAKRLTAAEKAQMADE
jgi:hypothetical protein